MDVVSLALGYLELALLKFENALKSTINKNMCDDSGTMQDLQKRIGLLKK